MRRTLMIVCLLAVVLAGCTARDLFQTAADEAKEVKIYAVQNEDGTTSLVAERPNMPAETGEAVAAVGQVVGGVATNNWLAAIAGITTLATVVLGWLNKNKNTQLAATVLGVETGADAATKAAIKAKSVELGVKTALAKTVDSLT